MTPPRLRRWSARLAVACLAGLVAATVALYFAADESLTGVVLRYGPRWLALPPAGLVLLVALAARSRAGIVLAVAAVSVAAGPFAGGRVSPLAGRVADPGGRLRVMTLNGDAQAVDPDRVAELVRAEQPDVVALQDPGRAGRLRNFPDGWHTATSAGGLQVLARFPVTLADALHGPEFDGPGRGAARFRVATGYGDVTVVSVHLPSVRDGLEAVLRRAAGARGVMAVEAARRAAASGRVRAFVGDPEGTLVVAGDFNTPVEGPSFRRDWGDFTAAFGAAGTGFGRTMHSRRLAVRIDQILAGPAWDVRACWVGPDVGSAHRPVFADLAPAGGP